jgi:CBS domain-containing protein
MKDARAAWQEGDVDVDALAAFLAGHPPFDALDQHTVATIAETARLTGHHTGDVILDAFDQPSAEVCVVLVGRVDLWYQTGTAEAAEERLGEGGIFGFSAMLLDRPVGPRATAVGEVTVARLPGSVVLPAFASPRGAHFLAAEVSSAKRRAAVPPRYSLVEELIVRPPLVVDAADHVGDVARAMTEHGVAYAVVRLDAGRFGLVTDPLLRKRILVEGQPATTPTRMIMDLAAPTVRLGDSAAEALIMMLDRDAEFVLVTDRSGELRGVLTARDFAGSPTTAGVSLDAHLRRAATVTDLEERARQIPPLLADLHSRGLASGKVIAVYAAMRDTTVRRAIELVFDSHPDLSVDSFTWLSLGSNGRREAVLSSDIDSAAAFVDGVSARETTSFRAAFGQVNDLMARAGLSSDDHGVNAQRQVFARTNAEWRAAGQRWLEAPAENQGAMMTSLLVDGRPVYGDPGLPAVTRVFADLRRHPQTLRLLLEESLARRAKLRSVRDVLARRADTFDIKTNALLPIVNIGRWAALSVGSAILPTVERLRAASGSAMLPTGQADTLIEVFEVLQRIRLHCQLEQHAAGAQPSDVMRLDRLSPLDHSVIAQAVREISAVQRRMDNVALYVDLDAWALPASE